MAEYKEIVTMGNGLIDKIIKRNRIFLSSMPNERYAVVNAIFPLGMLILDEVQDISAAFHMFFRGVAYKLENQAPRKIVPVVITGDPKQQINRFTGVTPLLAVITKPSIREAWDYVSTPVYSLTGTSTQDLPTGKIEVGELTSSFRSVINPNLANEISRTIAKNFTRQIQDLGVQTPSLEIVSVSRSDTRASEIPGVVRFRYVGDGGTSGSLEPPRNLEVGLHVSSTPIQRTLPNSYHVNLFVVPFVWVRNNEQYMGVLIIATLKAPSGVQSPEPIVFAIPSFSPDEIVQKIGAISRDLGVFLRSAAEGGQSGGTIHLIFNIDFTNGALYFENNHFIRKRGNVFVDNARAWFLTYRDKYDREMVQHEVVFTKSGSDLGIALLDSLGYDSSDESASKSRRELLETAMGLMDGVKTMVGEDLYKAGAFALTYTAARLGRDKAYLYGNIFGSRLTFSERREGRSKIVTIHHDLVEDRAASAAATKAKKHIERWLNYHENGLSQGTSDNLWGRVPEIDPEKLPDHTVRAYLHLKYYQQRIYKGEPVVITTPTNAEEISVMVQMGILNASLEKPFPVNTRNVQSGVSGATYQHTIAMIPSGKRRDVPGTMKYVQETRANLTNPDGTLDPFKHLTINEELLQNERRQTSQSLKIPTIVPIGNSSSPAQAQEGAMSPSPAPTPTPIAEPTGMEEESTTTTQVQASIVANPHKMIEPLEEGESVPPTNVASDPTDPFASP